MSGNKTPQPKPAWVKLYLEKQSETSTMPPYIIGLLAEEKPGAYVLTKVLEYHENEDTYEMDAVEIPKIILVSRTYVWMCEVLGELPTTEQPYNGEGGLG